MVAAFYNRTSMMQWLVDHGADVNIADKEGNTALHIVAEDGILPSLHALLGLGAKVNAERKVGGLCGCDSRETGSR